MLRQLTATLVAVSLTGGFALVGCDRTVAEKSTETTSSDGTRSVDKTKTTQAPDGSTRTETEHSKSDGVNR